MLLALTDVALGLIVNIFFAVTTTTTGVVDMTSMLPLLIITIASHSIARRIMLNICLLLTIGITLLC